jgi:polyhydroxyalkanoate synthesis regulator phasin
MTRRAAMDEINPREDEKIDEIIDDEEVVNKSDDDEEFEDVRESDEEDVEE